MSYEGEPSYPSYEEYSGNNRAAHRESSRVSVAPATVFAKELKRLAPAPDRNLPKIGGPVDLPPAPQPTLDLITPEPIFPELAYSPTPAPFSPTPAPYSPFPAPYSPTPKPFGPTPAPHSPSLGQYTPTPATLAPYTPAPVPYKPTPPPYSPSPKPPIYAADSKKSVYRSKINLIQSRSDSSVKELARFPKHAPLYRPAPSIKLEEETFVPNLVD